MYDYIASKTKPKEKIANLIRDDGSLATSDEDKSNVLNNFFGSVFTKENVDEIPVFKNVTDHVLSDITVSDSDFMNALCSLKTCKSPGPDGFHPRVLKELAVQLAHPLQLLFL